MLLIAMGVMVLHLWYLFTQYTEWPVQTKISLGYKSLSFPEVTLCNTNVMLKGRFEKFNGAEDLKALVEALKPTNLVPDQYDPGYDPYATKQPQGNQPNQDSGQNQGNNQHEPPKTSPSTNTDGVTPDGATPSSGVTQPKTSPDGATPPSGPNTPPKVILILFIFHQNV